jgi:hypothetical protein
MPEAVLVAACSYGVRGDAVPRLLLLSRALAPSRHDSGLQIPVWSVGLLIVGPAPASGSSRVGAEDTPRAVNARRAPAVVAAMSPAEAIRSRDLAGVDAEPLRPCFGVACRGHAGCARYAAVDHSQADPATLVTCATGHGFPLFVVLSR